MPQSSAMPQLLADRMGSSGGHLTLLWVPDLGQHCCTITNQLLCLMHN